jgi:hypothetical protein
MCDPRLGLRRQGIDEYQSPCHSGARRDANYDVQLHIGESRDSGFASRPGMTLEYLMQFDTKVAVVIRADLEAWQKVRRTTAASDVEN